MKGCMNKKIMLMKAINIAASQLNPNFWSLELTAK